VRVNDYISEEGFDLVEGYVCQHDCLAGIYASQFGVLETGGAMSGGGGRPAVLRHLGFFVLCFAK
jgi:hypothetical protein